MWRELKSDIIQKKAEGKNEQRTSLQKNFNVTKIGDGR